MHKLQRLTLIGSLVLILGSFLPWISVVDLFGEIASGYEGIEVGYEGDGTLTIFRIIEIGPATSFLAATGVGLYVTFLGALMVVFGGLQRLSPEGAEEEV